MKNGVTSLMGDEPDVELDWRTMMFAFGCCLWRSGGHLACLHEIGELERALKVTLIGHNVQMRS